ncbi:MAG TPA: transglutaminase domain-containing protein, partial [Puia sp.]|nr:transglutaminase domain-containing protein [Puia sp.]
EYSTILPDNFNYAFSVQGNLPFFAISSDSVSKEMWNGRGNIEVMLYTKRWSMKDVPPLKKEPFVYDPDSYKSKISFQLSIYPLSYLRSQSVLRTWQQFSHWLLIDKNFAGLGMDTLWIKIAVNEIVSKASDSLDAARRIFAYVRDSFRCTENDWTSNDLQAVYDNKEGTDGEINTLLLAMLRKFGFRANPVLLSTRSNGLLNPKYPIYDRINYIVIQLAIDKNLYYLDASNRYHAFGKIPVDCYNGPAMVIDSMPYAVNFSADSIKENSMRTLFIYNSGKDSLEADCTYKPGFIESVDLREWMAKNKSAEYFDEIGKSYLVPVNWKSQSMENLQNKEESPSIHYTLNFSMADKETVYFDPLIGQSKTKNPFFATSRKYPIQLDNSFNKAYVLDMEIPKGFQVVELPKSTKVQLNDGEGSFEYSITMADGHIQFRYKLSLNKAVFPADNYEDLRNFFTMVTKKESEVVVFKKTQ